MYSGRKKYRLSVFDENIRFFKLYFMKCMWVPTMFVASYVDLLHHHRCSLGWEGRHASFLLFFLLCISNVSTG